MTQLETFKFKEIIFNRKQYKDGVINKMLLKKTFSSWNNIRKLDIFDISVESGYGTVYNDQIYYSLLQILLSFKSLQSLKINITLFENNKNTENTSLINTVLPYFQHFKCLKELYLFITVSNFCFIENILKTIQTKTPCNKFRKMGIYFGVMDDDYSTLNIDAFVIQCMTTTTDMFEIELAAAVKDYYGSIRNKPKIDELMFFSNFVKCFFKFRKDINIKELKIKFVYFADLIHVMPRISKYTKLLSVACDEIGCNLNIIWIHGDEIYEKHEWIEIYNQLSSSGFLVNHTAPDLTMDCCLLYHRVNENFWILLLFVFVLTWKQK
eukprot:2012_1